MPTAQSPKSTKPRVATARAQSPAPAKKAVEAPAPEPKVVRDGFTMPQSDFDTLKALKAQCIKGGLDVKKSELLRAGVQALAALPAAKLIERMRALPAVKAGRKKTKA